MPNSPKPAKGEATTVLVAVSTTEILPLLALAT
jgi:hypothetical protein